MGTMDASMGEVRAKLAYGVQGGWKDSFWKMRSGYFLVLSGELKSLLQAAVNLV